MAVVGKVYMVEREKHQNGNFVQGYFSYIGGSAIYMLCACENKYECITK